MIPIQTHKKILQEIKERHEKEFMIHKLKWEKVCKEREQLEQLELQVKTLQAEKA